jgi:hypothetical protein
MNLEGPAISLHEPYEDIDGQKAGNHIYTILKSNIDEDLKITTGCFLYMAWFDCTQV